MKTIIQHIEEKLRISNQTGVDDKFLLSWEDFLEALRHKYSRTFVTSIYPEDEGPIFTDPITKHQHEVEYITHYSNMQGEECVKIRCFRGFIYYVEDQREFVRILGSDDYEAGIPYYNELCKIITDKV